jgi:dienelactone hydrolase
MHERRLVTALVAALLVLFALSPMGAMAESPSPGTSGVPITLEPVSDPGYRLASVAPVGWEVAGPGIRARKADAADPTLLALQSVPLDIEALWPSLLPQLGLTEVPDASGTRTTRAGLSWQLFRVPARGVIADLALAEGAETSYLVLLVSRPGERDDLASRVFLPAVDALTPLAAERTPAPSGMGYTETDISFPGGADDVTLAGTLTMPSGPGPHPGVVLMTGSGAQDRDESLPGMALRPFALIADALGRAGIAVLRYDDRGTASSTGDYGTATIPDFTADGAAAVGWLRQVPGVDPSRVGVLGHSEGGAYIASIAADDPDVAFVVGLAPMVRHGVDLLVDQNGAILRTQGASEAEVEAAMDHAYTLYQAILAGDTATAAALVRASLETAYDALPPDQQAQLGDRDTYVRTLVDAQMPNLTSPWFVSLLRADPSLDWARVRVPVLGVFGGKDVQVLAGPESDALEAALATAGNERSRIEVIADANHLFQSARTGALEEYATLDQAFTPELLPLLTDWIREVTGLGG